MASVFRIQKWSNRLWFYRICTNVQHYWHAGTGDRLYQLCESVYSPVRKRAHEVGVRKAIGSQRIDLIFQFLAESFLLRFRFFIFGYWVRLSFPAFNTLTKINIGIPLLIPFRVADFCLYSSYRFAGRQQAGFFLSSFQPVKVLKGRYSIGQKGNATT